MKKIKKQLQTSSNSEPPKKTPKKKHQFTTAEVNDLKTVNDKTVRCIPLDRQDIRRLLAIYRGLGQHHHTSQSIRERFSLAVKIQAKHLHAQLKKLEEIWRNSVCHL